MSSKLRLRPLFAPVVKVFAKFFIKFKVTPNIATGLMLISALIAASGLFYFNNLLWFGIWVFITGIMDGVDGAIARLTNHQSKFGSFFDSSMDRISESILYFAISWSSYDLMGFSIQINQVIVAICLVCSFMISYSRARVEIEAKSLGKKFDTNIGLMARSERLFFLFILSIISSFLPALIFSIGLLIFSILIFQTFCFRILTYRKYLMLHP